MDDETLAKAMGVPVSEVEAMTPGMRAAAERALQEQMGGSHGTDSEH